MKTLREIKFRAWDKQKKKMFTVWRLNWIEDHIQIEFPLVYLDNSISYQPTIDIELMQYTGIKDKNNVKQFESDLVIRESQKGEIRWDELEARFRVYCDNAKPISSNYPVSSDWEVIGNKYENS